MRVLVFSTRPYDREYLDRAGGLPSRFEYTAAQLDATTAALATGCSGVCCFVDDRLDAAVLQQLKSGGTQLVLLRSTGFNNVDVEAAHRLGITVARVAAYSPYAVAEFAVGLMLALNRKIHRAYNRVREGNFLLDGLLGFDLHGRTVGVVGTGRIGTVTAGILQGFGCRVLACDPVVNDALVKSGVYYVDFDTLLASADIVTLHVPLTAKSRHMMDARAIDAMRPGAMLINTSRGGLVETGALIAALKSGHLGAVGLDVYEEEEQLYYRDLSESIITDDLFMRLVTFHNVIITGHQAFFTHEALTMIAQTTVRNLDNYSMGRRDDNVITQAGLG